MVNRLWEPGERVDKWLILDRRIGASGVVYVLRELDYRETPARPAVVIGKTLRPEWSTDKYNVNRFEQEAYAWLSLGVYKHIVRLFFVDRLFNQVFAFGEYIPETLLPNTLRGWIDSNIIELESALCLGVQICRALAYSRSRGVLIHQDLKPENIMITGDGVVKVTDWGLSHMKPGSREGLFSTGNVPYHPESVGSSGHTDSHGTPGYVAPELLNVGSSPTPQADMFGLGVVLVEMISGRRPGADKTSAELMNLWEPLSPPLRSEIAKAISACLSSSPDDRPKSPNEVEKVLAAAFAEIVGVPVEEPPRKDWDKETDLTQRAYGLFMLGRLDEAMKIMHEVAGYRKANDAGTVERKPTVVLMDYKEHGIKPIVPTEVIEQAEKELECNPASSEALKNAVLINNLAGRFDRALELSQLWLKQQPNNPEALKSIWETLAQQEKWQEAVTYIDKAAALQFDDAELWMTRSKYSSKSGDAQSALCAAKKGVEIAPDNEDARTAYGHLLAESGDYAAALNEFQETARLNPESALALYNIGTSWNKLGRSDYAFQYLQQAVAKDPGFVQAWNTLGVLSVQINAFQEALIYFERAIEADSQDARPWFNKGKVFQALEKFEEARAAYLTAIQIDPGYQLANDALDQLETEHLQ